MVESQLGELPEISRGLSEAIPPVPDTRVKADPGRVEELGI
jgi:hypothetical protein